MLMFIILADLVFFILNGSWITIDEFAWLSENNDVFVFVFVLGICLGHPEFFLGHPEFFLGHPVDF